MLRVAHHSLLALPFAGIIAAGGSPTRVMTAPVTRAVATGTVALSPDSISGAKDDTRSVNVNASVSGGSLGSYNVAIKWDSTVVRLDSVRIGTFVTPTTNLINGGELRLSAATASTSFTGSLVLAKLYFRFVDATPGKRTTIVPTFTEFNAGDFSSMLTGLTVTSGVAVVLPRAVKFFVTPDSIGERVGFKPSYTLMADLSASTAKLGSYGAKITWDSTVARLDSVKAGTYASPASFQPHGAELRLAAADANGVGGAPFALAVLYFRFVTETFGSITTLTITATEAREASTFANLLPGVTTRTGVGVVLGVYRGDVNLDGSITAADASGVLQAVVGLTLPSGFRSTPNGDANCNTKVEAFDAAVILNRVVGNNVATFCVGTIK